MAAYTNTKFVEMESNQTLRPFSGQEMINGTDYAEFVQFVNHFNWSQIDSDPFSISDWFNLTNSLVPDDDTFNSSTPNATNWNGNSSLANATVTTESIWEAGKVRIPLYRSVQKHTVFFLD